MFTPDSPLYVPTGPVTAYFLTGEWFPKDRRPVPEGGWNAGDAPCFRDSPIVRTVGMPSTLASDCREIIADAASYGGEPMRCFMPRHGLSFAAIDAPSVDVLICFECHSLYYFEGEQRKRFALTERTMQRLGVIFSCLGPIITRHSFP